MRKEYRLIAALLAQIREDWETHFHDWTLPGFRAMAVYRIGNWIHQRREGVLQRVAFRFYLVMYRYVRNQYGMIGDDCMIRQNVTIGSATPYREFEEAPKLGSGVQIGAGAVIVGKIKIGDGARIGPNAVVLTNVPAGASVFVHPPRIISLKARAVGLLGVAVETPDTTKS
jgi:serine O-acetyltransferase